MIKAYFPSLAGCVTNDRKGASLIMHDDKKNCIMIDGGEGVLLTRTIDYLHRSGITHVTHILTHWHPDHDRGLRGLLESDIIVDKIYCPPVEEVRKLDSDDYARGSKIMSLAKSLKKTIISPPAGMWSEYRCGEMRFQIYRRAANTGDYADYRVNNTSMSTFFPDLLTLDNGDTIRVAEAVKNISGTPIFFVIPHHGNACNTSAANAMKQKGAKICYYTNPEPYVGGTGFTATGARKTKEVGILTLGCMKEVTVEYDNKKMTIRQGINTYVYNIPYSSGTWEKTADGHWKYKKDGKYLTGSQQIAGAWYYFDDDGIMQTGLVTRGRYHYWYDLKTGTLTKSTWISDGHYWRYFDEWGQAKTGWWQDQASKKWCYLDRDTKGGKLVAEWFHDPFQKCWYRLDKKGWMVKDGVHDVDGKRYRFDNYGRTVTEDGKLADKIEDAEVKKNELIKPIINMNKGFKGYNTSLRTKRIEYIVIHYTGAAGSAKNNIEYFNGGDRQASADFFVGYNGEIWQYNPSIDAKYSWHCGGGRQSSRGGSFYGKCTNGNSIGIEMCTQQLNGKWIFKDATINSAAYLVQYLMHLYGIDKSHIIRHFDVTGKKCPGVDGWTEPSNEWDKFKSRIETI